MPSDTYRTASTQRSHTIRSAQKLGSIFGATPCVVEGFDSHGECSDASSILSTGSSRSSSSSISFASPFGGSKSFKSSRSSRGSGKAPAPILLPIDTLTVHSHHGSSPLDSSSPLSSPDDMQPPNTATRRRQLSKVKRTLGENVPPELIFGIPPTKFTTKAMLSIGRRRGKSLSISGNDHHTAQAQQPTASDRYARRPSVEVPRVSKDMPFYGSWDAAPFVDDLTPQQRSLSNRVERDWEGAWNRQSMGEVRSKLRSLRA